MTAEQHELLEKARESIAPAYELRHTGDYSAPGAVPRDRAAEQIDRAEEFVAATEGLIRSARE